jgi:hypothetical protein
MRFVGIRGTLPLLDAGTLNRPEFSRYDIEGKKWIIKGHDVDISADHLPHGRGPNRIPTRNPLSPTRLGLRRVFRKRRRPLRRCLSAVWGVRALPTEQALRTEPATRIRRRTPLCETVLWVFSEERQEAGSCNFHCATLSNEMAGC